jgi:hypothetical protein
MTKITVPVHNLIGGVSQQAEDIRYSGQHDEQINAYPSVVDGLAKRHPTEFVAKALSGVVGSDLVHSINRSAEEKYLAVINKDAVKVFDLDGEEFLVRGPGDTTPNFHYLSTLGPANLLGTDGFAKSSIPGVGWRNQSALEPPYVVSSENAPDGSGAFAWRIKVDDNPNTASPTWYRSYLHTDFSSPYVRSLYLAAGESQHFSSYFKAETVSEVRVAWRLGVAVDATYGTTYGATFSLVGAGAVLWSTSGIETKILSVGDGWYYCRISMDIGSVSGPPIEGDDKDIHIDMAHNGPGLGTGGQSVLAYNCVARDGGEADIGLLDTDSIKAITVNDYTFILNSNTVVEKSQTTTGDPHYWDAHLNIGLGNYSTDYTLDLELTTAGTKQVKVVTWDGVVAAAGEMNRIKTDLIADSMINGPVAVGTDFIGGSTASGIIGIEAERVGSTIRIRVDSPEVIEELTVTDSMGDNATLLMWEGIPSSSKIPRYCTNGFRTKVTKSVGTDLDDYWLEFHTDVDTNNHFGLGHWEESVEPGIKTKFRDYTMPHQLVRLIDDQAGTVTGTAFKAYFEFSSITFDSRVIGDDNTNPFPSFLDKKINDIFFYKGRLGFLSDENVILSEVNEYFNFFRTTVRALIDSDPIDVSASHTNVAILNAAVAYEENLVLFSERDQFVLQGSPTLTPKTASIVRKTAFENYRNLEPVLAGHGVLFGYKDGPFSGLRELTQSDIGDGTYSSFQLTAHVPHYLKGQIKSIAASTLSNTAVLLTDDDLGKLYIYKWHESGGKKLQSAWCTYTFEGATIRSANWFEDVLYLTIQYADGLYIEKMVVDPNPKDDYSTFKVLLDRRINEAQLVSAVYAPDFTTILTLPYDIVDTASMRVVTRSTSANQATAQGFNYPLDPVTSFDVTTPGAHKIILPGNMTATPLWIGSVVPMEVTLSKLSFKERGAEGSETRVLAAVNKILFGNLSFHNTGYFEVETTDRRGNSDTSIFNGATLGDQAFILGQPSVTPSGTKRFPVLSKPTGLIIKIKSSSHLPCNFLSAEWESNVVLRGQRHRG